MNDVELIVYATPTGPLALACDRYWDEVIDVGRTTAQAYPPHCTLTGFFHRGSGRLDRVGRDLSGAVGATAVDRAPCVEVTALRVDREWVGLELDSVWLSEVTERFVARHRTCEGEDTLRPKSWLHLSLAYGVGFDPVVHGDLALRLVDPDLAAGWEIGLWQRDGDRWTRLLVEVVIPTST